MVWRDRWCYSRSFEVFFLTDIGHEAHDIPTLFKEPSQDAARVKTARVGEHNLWFSHLVSEHFYQRQM